GILLHAHNGDDFAVFRRRFDIDDALAAAALSAVLGHTGTLAVAVFGYGQDHVVLAGGGDCRHDKIFALQPDADDAISLPAHLAHIRMQETDAHAGVRSDEDGLVRGHHLRRNQLIVVRHAHCDNSAARGIAEIV